MQLGKHGGGKKFTLATLFIHELQVSDSKTCPQKTKQACLLSTSFEKLRRKCRYTGQALKINVVFKNTGICVVA